jgi:hypothetical protein
MRIDGLNPSVLRRYVLTPVLVILQVGVAIAAPLSHAHAETLTAERAVETTHSKQCAVIHSDAQCGVTAFKYQYAAAPIHVALTPIVRITAYADILARRPERVRRLRANGERAPPSS